MKSVLFSRPDHDDITYYLFLFSKELVEMSHSKFNCLDLKGNNATKSKVTSMIIDKDPSFIMFNGHGSSSCICGYKDEILINKGENAELLRNKIVYSLSCSSALELGPESIKSGTISFIGYDDDFALGMDANCQSAPYRDKRARLFLEPSNLLVKSLLKGNTVKESTDRAKNLMKKNLIILRTDPSPDAIYYAPFLFYNYLSLVAHGKQDASLA